MKGIKAEIEQARRQSPFKHFKLHLDNGRELPVWHPDALQPNKSKTTWMLLEGENWWIIDTAHISSLSYSSGLKRSLRNARAKK